MITRYRAWMDGTALDEIADSIYITDIVEPETQVEVISLPLAGRSGSRLQSNHRRSKTVLIRLMIREYDVAARKDVLNKVLTWAQGEELEINDRDGLVLYVRLDNVPQISSLKWTETITLSFTAWDVPYWQLKSTVGFEAANLMERTFSFYTDGNLPALVNFGVSNTGTGTVTDVTASANNSCFIHFSGLQIRPGSAFRFSHDERGLVTAKVDGVSVMDRMTADSSDDLMTDPRIKTNKITIRADATVTITARMRWRWL